MIRSTRILITALLALATFAVGSFAQKSLYQSAAISSGGNYAWEIAPIADIDGDGVLDFLVTDPFNDSAGTDAGAAWVVSGASGTIIRTHTGNEAGDLFGYSASGVGDIDGDGTVDYAIGAPGTAGTSAMGYVTLYSGATGLAIRTHDGIDPGGQFGAAVGGAGGLMADDQPGVVVGAPSGQSGSTKPGKVYVYNGSDGSLTASFTGDQDGDEFGCSIGRDAPDSIGGPGTLFADDEPGVIIGATAGGNGGNGYVKLLRRSDLSLIARVDGDAAADGFGTSVASLGDVNGDGKTDVAVGSNAGYARVLSGADGATLQTFSGSVAGKFGSRVAAVGDLSEDGVPDVAVAEPAAADNGVNAGRAHVFSGADGAVVHSIHGPANSGFSSAIAYAGDQDGDGLTEVLVGAPDDDNGASPAGNVYSLSLTRLEVIGVGEPGVSGVPRLRSEGGAGADPELVLFLEQARATATATLVMGSTLTVFNGDLVPTADTVITGLTTDENGNLEYAFTLPSNMPPGFTLYYQYQVVDPAAAGGVSRSQTIGAMLP